MQTIIDKAKLDRLVGASANLQGLVADGHLAAGQDADSVNLAVTAFDALAVATAAVQSDQKAASPFLRYRREIMADTLAGAHLRLLILNLYSEAMAINLRCVFEHSDDHNTRVALECISSFTTNGDRDSQFMGLAMEIAWAEERRQAEDQKAKKGGEV